MPDGKAIAYIDSMNRRTGHLCAGLYSWSKYFASRAAIAGFDPDKQQKKKKPLHFAGWRVYHVAEVEILSSLVRVEMSQQ